MGGKDGGGLEERGRCGLLCYSFKKREASIRRDKGEDYEDEEEEE